MFLCLGLANSSVATGAAEEKFKYSENRTLYRFVLEEASDVRIIGKGKLLEITSRNDSNDVRVRVIPVDTLQLITKKVRGSYEPSDKYTVVRFEPFEEIRGREVRFAMFELLIDEKIYSLEEVIAFFD